MRVLLVSKFLHHVGGVETYLRWLADALQNAGHEVALVGMRPGPGDQHMSFGNAELFETPTRRFVGGSALNRARSAVSSVYSPAAAAVMNDALDRFRPDVVHYHGTCYQLTSSVVTASAGRGIKRIATAHEYKLMCANQRLWSDATNEVCTLCVGASRMGRLANPVAQSCIKSSRSASFVGGVEAVVSDAVWRRSTDLVLHAPSRFMEQSLREDGWSPTRIRMLDLPWPDPTASRVEGGTRFLYMGRLAVEKDVATLLRGWQAAGAQTAPYDLVIAGEGAAGEALRGVVAAERIPRVEFVGRVAREELQALLRTAVATVHPAAWLENSPFAVRESLMAGVPALVAGTGGMPELVHPGVTGMLVDHSVDGWRDAFVGFSESTLRAGPEVLSWASSHRTSEADHLAAMVDLYRDR